MGFLSPAKTAKAESGVGAFWMTYDTSVASITRSPQKLMREAQETALSNRHIRSAERVIAQRFSTVEWHLEDENDERIEEGTPQQRAIIELLEKPYRPQPGDPLNSTPRTRTGLWSLTCRHMGVCGNAFWYLDQAEALAGTPLQLLYINPARMTPAQDDNGNLYGWVLDANERRGGVPLEREKVIHFLLEPPDSGFLGHGLVESAMAAVMMGRMADRQATGVLSSGGRLAGVFSPKSDAIPPDQFEQLKTDLRSIAESPDAAKRALVLQGPIEFTRTSATPQELDLLAISTLSRDDILELWGVPGSSLGISAPAGLNSGGTTESFEPILWQNAIGPRLRSFKETVQFELLDRYLALGITAELEIEEPEFDDDAPMYEMASKAQPLPISNDERRALIGLDPFDPAEYGDLGKQVWLPANLVDISTPPAPTPPQLLPFTGGPQTQPPDFLGKASPMRKVVDTRYTPAIRKAVQGVLNEQRAEITSRVRAQAAHLEAKPSDTHVWWNQSKWDKRMTDVLRPYATAIAETTAEHVSKRFPGKADVKPNVLRRILAAIATRVVNINQTTRDSIASLIAGNIGKGGAELGDLVEQATAFDEARAETIARTESAMYMNTAQLSTFDEYGVTEVEAIDGDGDEECADRNGRVFSIEEAASIEDHPNGTLDWAPVLGKANTIETTWDPGRTYQMAPMVFNVHPSPVSVNVPEQAAPVVNVTTPDVTVNVPNQPTPVVIVPEQKAALTQDIRIVELPKGAQRIKRDTYGRITEVVDE